MNRRFFFKALAAVASGLGLSRKRGDRVRPSKMRRRDGRGNYMPDNPRDVDAVFADNLEECWWGPPESPKDRIERGISYWLVEKPT